MAFTDIQQLATQDTQEEKEKRRRAIEALDLKEKTAQADDLKGVLGLAANPKVTLSPGAQKEADQESLFAGDRTKRYQQARSQAIDTIPSSDETLVNWLGERGATLARETPQQRSDELAVDPRGRADRLSAEKDALTGEYGGAPSRAGAGGGPGADRFYYREQPNGTLAFTNIADHASPDEGWHRYNADDGTHKDLGAPGGDVGRISSGDSAPGSGGTRQQRARDALMRSLDLEIGAAKEAKLTPSEAAGALLKHEPAWQETFATEGYQNGKQKLREAVAQKAVPPEIAGHIEQQMDHDFEQGVKQEMGDSGIPADEYFRDTVNAKRGGRPDVTHAALSSGLPGAADESHAQVAQAIAQHAQAAPTGPGTQPGTSDIERQRMFAPGASAPEADPLEGILGGVQVGGNGESGLEGMLNDYSSFREGKGRYGYGESGPVGFAKDVGAFYGARLPQDLLSAILPVKGARAGSELTKLRAIANAFGKF